MTTEIALTESRALRAEYATRTDVLDRVKALTLLPDDVHATTELVAGFFAVDTEAIKKVVQRNREELTENGMRVLRGAGLREFKGGDGRDKMSLPSESAKASQLTVFNRRAILNVAMLLRDSDVARKVRSYLLDVEELAPADLRHAAIERAAISRAQLRMLDAARGLVDDSWLNSKARVVTARGLGEEPELDPMDKPLYVPDYLRERGVTSKKDLNSIQSWFGRRVMNAADDHGITPPEQRVSELPNGQLRETRAWCERHRPLFDRVWEQFYAADYDPPLFLT